MKAKARARLLATLAEARITEADYEAIENARKAVDAINARLAVNGSPLRYAVTCCPAGPGRAGGDPGGTDRESPAVIIWCELKVHVVVELPESPDIVLESDNKPGVVFIVARLRELAVCYLARPEHVKDTWPARYKRTAEPA